LNTHTGNQSQTQNALAEIKEGKHNTDNINHLKASTHQLVMEEKYDAALEVLADLAKARQVKTTNILWIGSYLKDIYFQETAKSLKDKFDKVLLEEMLFYYLKSCKLFDPCYEKIREHIKKFQD